MAPRGGAPRAPLLLLLLLLLLGLLCCLLGSASAQSTDCSGHGSYNSATLSCDCINAYPAAGVQGYTGDNCEIPVLGLNPATIATQPVMAALPAGGWSCYALALPPWNADARGVNAWSYMALQLLTTSPAGDPDIYGLFYDPSDPSTHPVSEIYSYDYMDTSSARAVVSKVKRSDYVTPGGPAYTGTYICINAYGTNNVSFTLRVAVGPCPVGFDAAGNQLVCSTQLSTPVGAADYRGSCGPTGTCACADAFKAPDDASVIYPGLGFEECSASVTAVPGEARSFSYEHQAMPGGTWRFYRFNVTPDDRQFTLTLVREPGAVGSDGACAPQLYVQRGAPPGQYYNQFDTRPPYHYYTTDVQSQTVTVEYGDGVFRPGVWYAGVRSSRPCMFHLAGARFRCPNDCSGQGRCVDDPSGNGTRTCACAANALGRDCSQTLTPAVFGQPIVWAPPPSTAGVAYTYVVLPEMSLSMAQHGVEFKLEADFVSAAWSANPFQTARPAIFLKQGGASLPSASDFTYKRELSQPSSRYSLQLCASQLRQPDVADAGGPWRVALYNPLSIYALQLNFTVYTIIRCPNACNSRGNCAGEGVCQCFAGWGGDDCGIDLTLCKAGSWAIEPGPDDSTMCARRCIDGKMQADCTHRFCSKPGMMLMDGICRPPMHPGGMPGWGIAVLVLCMMAVGCAGGAAGWWYYTTRWSPRRSHMDTYTELYEPPSVQF